MIGPGACAFLERICANRIDKPVGSVVYTQMLNPRGGIECDLSVIRRAPDRFLLVTGTAFGVHDRRWIEGQAPKDGTVYVSDVTSALACFGLWGPRARDILQPLTKTSLANEDFPYLTRRRSASATCRASPSASRTSESSAGSSTARPSTACGSGTRCGRPGGRTVWSPAATGRSTRFASRRATGPGPPT